MHRICMISLVVVALTAAACGVDTGTGNPAGGQDTAHGNPVGGQDTATGNPDSGQPPTTGNPDGGQPPTTGNPYSEQGAATGDAAGAPLFGSVRPGDAIDMSLTVCPIAQAINPTATQPAGCQPGERCSPDRFTEASGMAYVSGLPAGCVDVNQDGMPDGTCEYVFACIPSGTKKTGEACNIDMQTGTDDCEAGDICHLMTGTGATARNMCVELCPATDGDASCAHLATDRPTPMPASATHCFRGGFFPGTNVSACTTPCNLGDGTCTAPGTSCKLLIAEQEFMCWGVGTIAVGTSCEGTGTAGCVAEASCARTDANDPNSPPFCRRNCSDSMPCAAGFTCRTVPGVRNGGGTCQPQ